MHILPELKKLEKEFPNELVVIGVHSAKFDTEKDADNIRAAVLRLRNRAPGGQRRGPQDLGHLRRQQLADDHHDRPRGDRRVGPRRRVQGRGGPGDPECCSSVLPRPTSCSTRSRFRWSSESESEKNTPLRFPGKVLADEAGRPAVHQRLEPQPHRDRVAGGAAARHHRQRANRAGRRRLQVGVVQPSARAVP